MGKYVLLMDGVVVHVQPHDGDGLTPAPDTVIPGQVRQPDGLFADPPTAVDDLWVALRAGRDTRLATVTAVLDRHRNQRDFGLPTTLTDAQAVAWATYAQALRDLPEVTADPANPVWPPAPSDPIPAQE